MADDGAIRVLEDRQKALLKGGFDSIPDLEEQIQKSEEALERNRVTLRDRKQELLDIEKALALLKAGK